MSTIIIPLKHIIFWKKRMENFAPGDEYDHLTHLLCLMFVGFKLYDPKIDCGLDFGEMYELARETFGAVVH